MTKFFLSDCPNDVTEKIQGYRGVIYHLMEFSNKKEIMDSGLNINVLGSLLSDLDAIEQQAKQQQAKQQQKK